MVAQIARGEVGARRRDAAATSDVELQALTARRSLRASIAGLPDRYANFSKELRHELAGYWAEGERKPIATQLADLYRIWCTYNCVPLHYLTMRLYARDFDGDVCDFLPRSLLKRYRDSLNVKAPEALLEDKLEFYRMARKNGLPTVPILFVVSRGGEFHRANGRKVSFAQFAQELARSNLSEVFLKPTTGIGGSGVCRFQVRDGGLWCGARPLGEAQFVESVFSGHSYEQVIVQPVIRQHAILERLNSGCVNTVRLDSLVIGGSVVHNFASMRLGDGVGMTDNYALGGLAVRVDLETGRLGRTASNWLHRGGQLLTHHPVSGVEFGSVVLPFWAEAKEVAQKAARAFLPARCLGWDIAFTPDGPVLVEGNYFQELFRVQEAIGGLRCTPLGRHLMSALESKGG